MQERLLLIIISVSVSSHELLVHVYLLWLDHYTALEMPTLGNSEI